MFVFFRLKTIKRLINYSKDDLIDKALSIFLYRYENTYRRKDMVSIILEIIMYIHDNKMNRVEKHRKIEKPCLRRLLYSTKDQLINEIAELLLEINVKGKTRKELLYLLIEHHSTDFTIEQFDHSHFNPEYFKQIKDTRDPENDYVRYEYNDPYMIGEDNIFRNVIMKELDKYVNHDVAGIIIRYIIVRNIPEPGEVLDLIESHCYRSTYHPIRKNQLQNQDRSYRYKSDRNNYEKSVNVFKKSLLYNLHFHGMRFSEIDKISRTLYNPKMRINNGFEEMKKQFSFVDDWYSQVCHNDSNSFKPAVIQMRKMIIKKYSAIIDQIKFGAINDEKRFHKLLAGLKDNDIESLEYLQFLLSTKFVFFIDRMGRIVYDWSFNRGYHTDIVTDWAVKDYNIFPGFYKAFFLLEPNSDGSVQISPVNFGILKDRVIPRYRSFTPVRSNKVRGMKK